MPTELPDLVAMWNGTITTNISPSGTLNPDFPDNNKTTVSPTKPPNTLHLEYIGYVFVPLFLVSVLRYIFVIFKMLFVGKTEMTNEK